MLTPSRRHYVRQTFLACKCMHCFKQLQTEDIQFLEIGDNSYKKRGLTINKASYIPGFYSHSVIILSDRCQIQALSLSLYIDGVMPTILRNSSTNVVYDLKPTLSAMAFSV